MPIPRKSLEQAQLPLAERILAVLQKDRTNAYSLVEIYATVEGYEPLSAQVSVTLMDEFDRHMLFAPYSDALGKLVARGDVVGATYQGQPHFAAK